MNTAQLPGTDLSVSQLCFGCWGITSDFHWGDRDEQQSLATISAALDAGINFFDTAPVYGDGNSEILLGKALAGRRDQLVIASKVRPDMMQPKDIPAACEQTLQRLNTDYLDLYQTHWTSPDTPPAETWQAMLKLKEAGKVRHLGVCNMGPNDLDAVCPIAAPVTNQLPYNLLWRMIESAILPRCREQHIGVLVYSPLMHGLLSGKYQHADDVPTGRTRSRHFNTDRELARHGEAGCEEETFAAIAGIREICESVGRQMADVALSWCWQQPGVTSVIAGASSPEQLAANVATMSNPVSDDVIQALNAATSRLHERLGSNPDMWQGTDKSRFK